MDARKKQCFQHVAHYGQASLDSHDYTGPVPASFTFNSPVGVCMDRHQQVWVCDTGNNRIVILDRSLTRILRILRCPDPDGSGPGAIDFRMPFHVCPHPDLDRVFITDMGNSRVVAMDYAAGSFSFAFAFGNKRSTRFEPLQDPNGVTVVSRKNGGYHIHVNDEFFHTPSEPLRNRCVRFDEKGRYVDEFRSVIDPDGTRHDLYWPQGLSSDDAGNLYIANTGSYEILKCASTATISADYCIAADQPVISHQFQQPSGIGMLNIMRDVNVIGERVFVPDHVLNSISVYSLDGQPLTTIDGVRPAWNHGKEPLHSLTDPLYYAIEDDSLVNPYVICQGETSDIYLISEPFTSRILKLRIDDFSQPDTVLTILAALGGRRDEPGIDGQEPQFNCVTSVVSLQRKTAGAPVPDFDSSAELPAYLRLNPFQAMYASFGKRAAEQYDFWFGDWARRMLQASGAIKAAPEIRLNVDAGNWQFKAYREDSRQFTAIAGAPSSGYFLPGNLAMAVYHPRTPLLGQLCPGTPIVLVGNFNLGTVSLYQVCPLGKLINYGMPFGFHGQADGCLSGPQGMAVSDDGEVFVVDALNNRLSKWQFLQTGQVVFIRNFVWQDDSDDGDSKATFTPTDVAIDADNRLFVTDQFNNRICVFDRHGNSLWCCGQQGYWEEGEADGDSFMLPTSLAIDGEHLILNDLVNRALKIFRIGANSLGFEGGISLFKLSLDKGGVWMPFFMHAQDRQVFIADSTYNIVQVFEY